MYHSARPFPGLTALLHTNVLALTQLGAADNQATMIAKLILICIHWCNGFLLVFIGDLACSLVYLMKQKPFRIIHTMRHSLASVNMSEVEGLVRFWRPATQHRGGGPAKPCDGIQPRLGIRVDVHCFNTQPPPLVTHHETGHLRRNMATYLRPRLHSSSVS